MTGGLTVLRPSGPTRLAEEVDATHPWPALPGNVGHSGSRVAPRASAPTSGEVPPSSTPVDAPGPRHLVIALAPAFVEHYGTGVSYWQAMRIYPDARLAMVAMVATTFKWDFDHLFTQLKELPWC